MKKLILIISLSLSLFADKAYVCENVDSLIIEAFKANLSGVKTLQCKSDLVDLDRFVSKAALKGNKEALDGVLNRDCGAKGTSLTIEYGTSNVSFDISAFTVPYLKYVSRLICSNDIARLKKLALFTSRPEFSEIDYYQDRAELDNKYIPAADTIFYLEEVYEKDNLGYSQNHTGITFKSPIQIAARQICFNNVSKDKYYGHKYRKYLEFMLYLSQNRFVKVDKIIDKVDLSNLEDYCSDFEEL